VNDVLNFDTGNCETPQVAWGECENSLECDPYNTACMNIDGDRYKKCTPFPTEYYLGGYRTKAGYLGACNLYYLCNEYQNLKCSNFYANTTTILGTCVCFSKYYYFNGTMCVYGTRFDLIYII
jgi:hypothetical protein